MLKTEFRALCSFQYYYTVCCTETHYLVCLKFSNKLRNNIHFLITTHYETTVCCIKRLAMTNIVHSLIIERVYSFDLIYERIIVFTKVELLCFTYHQVQCSVQGVLAALGGAVSYTFSVCVASSFALLIIKCWLLYRGSWLPQAAL